MKTATCTLRSAPGSPYSQSRSYAHEVDKLPRETADAYEMRTWRNKCHTRNGHIYIPAMAFKMAVDTAAQMLGRKIPGKASATYTKFFLSGVLVLTDPVLPLTKDDVDCDRIFANADGRRGSGKRVWRMFPRIDEWEAKVEFHVLADEITPELFEEHLDQAGKFVGIGRFRPQNGGTYGRYKVEKVEWS